MSAGRRNMLTQAISLVLHHPSAASAVERPEVLAGLEKPGIPVLHALIEQARESPHLNTAALLERWRDKPEFERLAQLAADQPLVPDPGAAGRELKMAVEKLVDMLGPGARMDELLQKARDSGLNYDEKAELTHLLKSRGQTGSRS
jgi:DNA primase